MVILAKLFKRKQFFSSSISTAPTIFKEEFVCGIHELQGGDIGGKKSKIFDFSKDVQNVSKMNIRDRGGSLNIF